MRFSRRSPAAKGRIVTAVLTLGLAVAPASNVLAQSEDLSQAPASPKVQSVTPSETPQKGDEDAVFEAPGMPGVRMMAPNPDKPDSAPSPVRRPAITAAPAPKAGSGDRSTLAQAFSTGHDWNRARLLAAQSSNPAARMIVEWRYVLDEMSGASFDSINAFLNAHPNWPRHDALLIRAEKTMPADLGSRDVVAWYSTHRPLSGIGNIRLGSALMDIGKRADGMALIRRGWIDFTFSPFDESQIMSAHGDVLSGPEHKARLLKLLAHEDIGGAKRQMARVDADTRRLANALLQIKASPATAKQVLASFPDSARNAPELLFEAARALRRRNQDEAAWDLMTQAPTEKDDLAVAERWSAERQIMARDALKAGKAELAYQLASIPALDPDSGSAFMDAEFLAGWIALRELHKPELARYHFDRLAKGVTFPISVARAHYWLGRTWEALNNPFAAADEYRVAGYYSATFYGQLALANIAERPMLHLNSVATDPQPSERAAFEADDRVQAIRLLMQLGDRINIRFFALAIATDSSDAKRLQMLAELVASTGDQALAVKVAKNASYNDVYLQPYLHPLLPMPKLSGDAPEAALVLGLTRQESEFDSGAVSVAGARGLMQLMPASAKRAANLSRLAYRPNDLNKPDYNMQLGMTTLAEYLDRWGGSYVLAIASYNAGPSNVRNWVEAYGDPRDAGVDPIDWIESIPFPETRNYVQRVLENLQVYRNRLSNSDQNLVILSDLYRPNSVNLANARLPGSVLTSNVQNTSAIAPGPSVAVPGIQLPQ
jgi:soluble lytic murein transglycosylase